MDAQMYAVTVELDRRADALTDEQLDEAMSRLASLSAAIGTSMRGWVSVSVSLPAACLEQALILAVAAARSAVPGATAIGCQGITEHEQMARIGWSELPEVLSTSGAAEVLGVTRQRVLQMITEGHLQATRVGREYAVVRSSLPPRRGSSPTA